MSDTGQAQVTLTIDEILQEAMAAARVGLRAIIGEKPRAYDRADRFMEIFAAMLKVRLEDASQKVPR